MTKRVGYLGVMLVLVGACLAEAGIVSVSAVQVAKPGGVLPTRVTNDIQVDFTGFIRGQQMIVNLTTPATGGVFQRTIVGSNFPPDEDAFPDFADAPYDTFIAMGGVTAQTSPDLIIVGGAVDLQPGSLQQFNTNGLNVAWAPGTGVDIPDANDFTTARVTLSNTAMGTIQYFGSTSAGTGADLVKQGTIVNGVISFGSPNLAPIVDDGGLIPVQLDNSNNPPGLTTAMHQFVATDDAPLSELDWVLDSFTGPGVLLQPTIDASGKLSWVADGSTGGLYTATVHATDAGDLSDGASVSFQLTVPEPTSIALFGLALVGFAGFRRK